VNLRQLHSAIDVRAPFLTAAARGLAPDELPRFMRSVRSVRRSAANRVECTLALGPAARRCMLTVVPEADRVSWRSERSEGQLTLTPLSKDRSTLTVDITWHPRGITESLAALVGVDRRQLRRDLDRFRAVVESEAAEDELQRAIQER
jgi:uncharacterized membrane protein